MRVVVAKSAADPRWRFRKTYDESKHPRDSHGRWTSKPLSEQELDSLRPRWEKFSDPKLRQRSIDAMEYWMGPVHEDINDQLRGGEEMDWAYSNMQKEIRGLNRAFETAGHDMPRDAVMYRGVGDLGRQLEVGDVFRDRGFSATTNDPKIAQMFHLDTERGYNMRIGIPKGTRVLSPWSPDHEDTGGTEPELLLPRGTKFRVTHKEGRTIDVVVEK